jgi:hypothetical protein
MASTFISLPFNSLAVDNLVVSPEPISIAPGATIGISGTNQFEYNEVLSVAPGATITLLSRNFPTAYKLRRVDATGNCIGTYSVQFNNEDIDKKRSTIVNFNCEFNYETGITIPAGTIVSVVVTNSSDENSGDFAARLLFSQT